MSIVIRELFELGDAAFELTVKLQVTGNRAGAGEKLAVWGADAVPGVDFSAVSEVEAARWYPVILGEMAYGFETFTPVAPRTLPSLDSWMKAMTRRFVGSVSGFSLKATSCEKGFPLSSLPTLRSSSTTATCCSCLPEFSPADTCDAA